MNRRPNPFVRLAAVLAAAAALTGCATFTDDDVMARVDDAEITRDELEPLLVEYVERSELFGTRELPGRRTESTTARLLLRLMVERAAADQLLTGAGVDVSDDRQAFVAAQPEDSPLFSLTDEFQRLIADSDPEFRSQTLARIPTPDTDELRRLYAEDPARTGVVCLRHILVETEDEARQLADELADGADFATLATEHSTDPSAADSGGALASPDNDCLALETVLGGFDPAFAAGMLDTREAVPSQPVESSFGWHLILHRPWDEVADSVVALHEAASSGALLLDGLLAAGEIEVEPTYGTWSPVAGDIVPLG